MGELKKVLKLRTIISTSAGMAIATSCYLAGIQVATIMVGELAWISILLAGLLCLLSSMCFSELTSLYPTAAGTDGGEDGGARKRRAAGGGV